MAQKSLRKQQMMVLVFRFEEYKPDNVTQPVLQTLSNIQTPT